MFLYDGNNIEKTMTKEVIAVYPGTFDPVTRGHEDLVRRAVRLCSKLVVAVAVAHHKKTLFSVDERVDMARDVLADVPCVKVDRFDGLLKHFVEANRASVIVRGLRAVSDFDYEFQMAGMNRHLMPQVETIFLTPGEQFHFVSATFVREIAILGGDVTQFVAPLVAARLRQKHEQRLAQKGLS